MRALAEPSLLSLSRSGLVSSSSEGRRASLLSSNEEGPRPADGGGGDDAEVGVREDEVEVEVGLATSEPWLPELRRRKTFARVTGGLDEVEVEVEEG